MNSFSQNIPAKYFITGECLGCKNKLHFNTYPKNSLSKMINGCSYGCCLNCYRLLCDECIMYDTKENLADEFKWGLQSYKKVINYGKCLGCNKGAIVDIFCNDDLIEKIAKNILNLPKRRNPNATKCVLEANYSKSFDELYEKYDEFDINNLNDKVESKTTQRNINTFESFEKNINSIDLLNFEEIAAINPFVKEVKALEIKNEKSALESKANDVLNNLFNQLIDSIPEENRISFTPNQIYDQSYIDFDYSNSSPKFSFISKKNFTISSELSKEIKEMKRINNIKSNLFIVSNK